MHANHLLLAQQLAAKGQFTRFTEECQRLVHAHVNDGVMQQNLAALYATYGFLKPACDCLQRVCTLRPGDLGAVANLANVARDEGDHAQARELYTQLLAALPDHPVVRRNFLTGLEYDPAVADADRLAAVQEWGQWAMARVGGMRPRPVASPLNGRPLRIGYVGADFCQHTVGLFVKDVLAAHDASRVQVFVYSAGAQADWVTQAVRAASTFREVVSLDDVALAAQIRADGIDVLVDLSGHTAGSRLTAFALRPAPVLVSWLGYFATTGLPVMDAVLLDEWHAPPGTEGQFVEPILRLPMGRFCYRPVPWAPLAVSPPAYQRNGYITFGCFNNTAKLNQSVFEVWAQVLAAVPDARLILKWRTFNDEAFRQQITNAFIARGIHAERLELRGPSFHADLLKEYADIDIALDPFPFTGGLTSCEALWMGVPVVTWPQSRIVSRQTHAFLHQIGRPEWSAASAQDYVRIAVALAKDTDHLAVLRTGLRQQMMASPLMDVAGFTRQLEDVLSALFQRVVGE